MPLVGLAILYVDLQCSTLCLTEAKQQGTALCRLLLQVRRRIARYGKLEGIAIAQQSGGRREMLAEFKTLGCSASKGTFFAGQTIGALFAG
jgi:hypothetical protein